MKKIGKEHMIFMLADMTNMLKISVFVTGLVTAWSLYPHVYSSQIDLTQTLSKFTRIFFKQLQKTYCEPTDTS